MTTRAKIHIKADTAGSFVRDTVIKITSACAPKGSNTGRNNTLRTV